MCKLRVLVVGPYPQEEGKTKGGVQAVTYYLTEGLAIRGDMDVHVITLVSGLNSEIKRVSKNGVHVHLIPNCECFGCLTGFAVVSARIRKVMHEINPDIVHVHTQTAYPHAVLERGYPSVLTPHGVFYKEAALVEGFVNTIQSRLACGYERKALKRARHIILLNNYLAKCFDGLLDDANINWIDNPIDDKFFDVPDKSEPGAILFLGVFLERKGVLHLARAASILKTRNVGFKIWIVGPVGDQAFFTKVKNYVHENGLDNYIEFLGLVSEEEVMERYARCSMLVLPSFEETAPMVISQAQAAGKPVVASAVGGIPEMIKDDVTGYTVPYGDAEGLADRIGRLLADPEKRKKMGEAARIVAEQRYRRASVVEKTLKVYEEVLADAKR